MTYGERVRMMEEVVTILSFEIASAAFGGDDGNGNENEEEEWPLTWP